mmetsp:Transcript_25914/g.86304  ORF Transcript_25914/g.86304 Transcript_25914/m.86304 type:complete len:119 (-) Transcript_25914:200-556(-)
MGLLHRWGLICELVGSASCCEWAIRRGSRSSAASCGQLARGGHRHSRLASTISHCAAREECSSSISSISSSLSSSTAAITICQRHFHPTCPDATFGGGSSRASCHFSDDLPAASAPAS